MAQASTLPAFVPYLKENGNGYFNEVTPLATTSTTAKSTLSSMFSTPLAKIVTATITVVAISGVTAGIVVANRASNVSSSGPEQITLSVLSTSPDINTPSTMGVSWVIPEGASYKAFNLPAKSYIDAGYTVPVVANSGLPAVKPRALWGNSPTNLTFSSPANFTRYSYSLGIDWRLVVSNATSGALYSAAIGPLAPGTIFYYSVGDDANGFSTPTMAMNIPAAGTPGVSLAVIGDLGTTSNSSSTMEHVMTSHKTKNFAGILHMGDISYADGEMPVWDYFGRLHAPYFSFNSVVGKYVFLPADTIHEWGPSPGTPTYGQVDTPAFSFLSYLQRYLTPAGRSNQRMYYSLNYGLMHIVFVAGYCPEMRDWAQPISCLAAGSPQLNWLINDLASVNRAITPHVIVIIHQPWYNSNWSHRIATEGIVIMQALEDVIQGKVDLVLSGHVHSYERSGRAYGFSCNTTNPTIGNLSSPVYINVGDGGNREGLSTNWSVTQPSWSLLRQASFGHGELTAVNSTHMHWQWIQTPFLAPAIGDDFWIVKGDPGICGNGQTRLPMIASRL